MESLNEILEEYDLVPKCRMATLRQLEKELYADAVKSGDKQRDWANWLNQCFFPDVISKPKRSANESAHS